MYFFLVGLDHIGEHFYQAASGDIGSHMVIMDSGVAVTAYYSMADGAVPKDPVLQQIGAKYGKSAAQVGLRWLVQQGHIALSKTANPARVAENIAIFDFVLDETDMAAIAGLPRPDGRLVSPPGLAPAWDA